MSHLRSLSSLFSGSFVKSFARSHAVNTNAGTDTKRIELDQRTPSAIAVKYN